MASVAMNVITGAQNNNTIVFEQPAASQLQQKRLLQISDDKDKNREIRSRGDTHAEDITERKRY